ncbi:MAG TPA: UDP-N-acetylmuramoyl-L-alanine--D-glutamate ligase [Burkholderiales bacterium]|nr:UDP-N-acetylmuramoyl-L-alanine--D-glutamate ligase [Burkholderiales bacterium]
MELKGKTVLVLGMGDTGLSCARFLARRGAWLRVADTREAPPRRAELEALVPRPGVFCGPFRPEAFAGADLLVISPGVPREEPRVAEAADSGVPVVGDMELFALALQEAKAAGRAPAGTRVIAITGTNGKTTVTSMAGAMCRRAGLDTEVAGNISPAVLDAWLAREDAGRLPRAWVLEVSSFQLESTCSLASSSSTVLNVSEDHLDRYSGMAAYAAAKARILNGCAAQVLNRDDSAVIGMEVPGVARWTFGRGVPEGARTLGLVEHDGETWLAEGSERLMRRAELPLSGLHNALNALAALALCRAAGLPREPLVAALREFRGLPHRVERVGELRGVEFYDDSKGTNVGATVAALEGLGRRVVLIAGGDGKGQNFAPLAPAVAGHARAVVLIGRDGPLIAAALEGCGVPLTRAQTLEQAVREAWTLSRPGDAVLLSPACASFDMFRDYAHRAEVFVAAVRGLREAGS